MPILEQMKMEKASLLSENHDRSRLWNALRSPKSEEQRQTRQLCFLAANVTFLVISILVNITTWSRSVHSKCITPTDTTDAHKAIEYESRTFTGALVYDPEKKVAFRKPDGEREYFGPPSKEIDDAWHELLHGEFPVMTDEEAAPFRPDLTTIPSTGRYHFEPDMFHTLHCVNALRLEVSKSLYNVSTSHHHGDVKGISFPDGWDVVHMEHCMDRIRQSIMCHGDLTPSPLYFWPGFKIALGRTGAHTCRKWQPIREWMDRRGEQGPLLSPV
ncbi:Hypothetical predicted protein [Lecanosticta acicola]|uniref:Tat pathway signal sequence n=1 Tax=Lecanosticta acicola TaxID=111012 RepID=A0AAI9EE88_9PEZI|nr:Hypothetical predicted protein [Lecanosticta acicola]